MHATVPILLAMGLGSGHAAAQDSAAARYLVQQEIAAACPGGGSIDSGAVIERDLTGDGRGDLIISHEGIRCAGGGRSAFCGAMLCSFNVYRHDGDLLLPARDMLGAGVSVDGDRTIRWIGDGGAPRMMRWTGAAFE